MLYSKVWSVVFLDLCVFSLCCTTFTVFVAFNSIAYRFAQQEINLFSACSQSKQVIHLESKDIITAQDLTGRKYTNS